MAEVKIQLGAVVDVLTQQELQQSLAASQESANSWLRAIKWMRLPETLSGKAASNVLTLGETKGQILGPRSGYAWAITRLVVDGLTSGGTPDVVNLYKGTPAGRPTWQFNGNNFAYTFDYLQLTFLGGETMSLASTGTFNATGTITLSGELVEVPQELLGRLVRG